MSTHVIVAIPCLLAGGTERQTLMLVRVLTDPEFKVESLKFRVTVVCYFEYEDAVVE